MAIFFDGYGGCCTCIRDKCTDDCATYRRFNPKPITNSMRIRTMTDEELAEFLNKVETDGRCGIMSGRNGWLNWLKQEANT